MASNKKQIRGIRIILTVLYGFILSSILFRYIIHGVVEIIRQPTNPFAIGLVVVGSLVLLSIILATYATWFDNTVILLVSGFVLIFVFVLTLVFGIVRIVKTRPYRDTKSNVIFDSDDQSNVVADLKGNDSKNNIDIYILYEDITKLIVELIFILFAILATFTLHRYVKAKYAAVPTTERPK